VKVKRKENLAIGCAEVCGCVHVLV
jgi:hypothetical protein